MGVGGGGGGDHECDCVPSLESCCLFVVVVDCVLCSFHEREYLFYLTLSLPFRRHVTSMAQCFPRAYRMS